MPKVITTVGIDDILFNKAKSSKINFSATLEESLRYKIAFQEQDLSSISKKRLQIELEKEEKKLQKIALKVEELRKNLQILEEKEQKQAQKELKQQEESIKNKRKCTDCGNLIPEDKKSYPNIREKGDVLCKNCFLSV